MKKNIHSERKYYLTTFLSDNTQHWVADDKIYCDSDVATTSKVQPTENFQMDEFKGAQGKYFKYTRVKYLLQLP